MDVAPVAVEKVPIVHGVHGEFPVAEYCPTGHGETHVKALGEPTAPTVEPTRARAPSDERRTCVPAKLVVRMPAISASRPLVALSHLNDRKVVSDGKNVVRYGHVSLSPKQAFIPYVDPCGAEICTMPWRADEGHCSTRRERN